MPDYHSVTPLDLRHSNNYKLVSDHRHTFLERYNLMENSVFFSRGNKLLKLLKLINWRNIRLYELEKRYSLILSFKV